MHGQLILQLNESWYRVEGDQLVSIGAYPSLDMPTTLITDFGGALTDVIAMEGRPSYASMMIEKRTREQGLIDSEGRVLVHRLLRSGGGFRALFTVVPISRWQKTMDWAERQPVECLVVSLQALLCRLAGASKQGALVLRHERHFIFMQVGRREFRYEHGFVYGDLDSDWLQGATSLGQRVREILGEENSNVRPNGVDWYRTWPAPVLDESQLVKSFSGAAGLDAHLVDQPMLHRDGGAVASIIPMLRDMVRGVDALNSGMARTSAILDQLMPMASAAMITIAMVLGAVAWTTQQQVDRVEAGIASEQAALASKQSQLTELQKEAILPADYQSLLPFVTTMVHARAQPDPVQVIKAVRRAAATHVRILRVALQHQVKGAELIRVEGMMPGGGLDTRRLAAFVGELRQQGFTTTPVRSVESNAIPGVFAYALTPVGQTK